MKDAVHTEVCNNPGIDTPLVCLNIHSADIVDSGDRDIKLALFLMTWHKEAWKDTCDAVDELIKEDAIIFTDAGNLYQVGYSGEII